MARPRFPEVAPAVNNTIYISGLSVGPAARYDTVPVKSVGTADGSNQFGSVRSS